MSSASVQPGLFDAHQPADTVQEAAARGRMQEMIGRLKAMATPPWRTQMDVILDDGAFQRAMRLVPPGEAQALWAEFDAHTERLYAIWLETNLPQPDPDPSQRTG